MTAHITPDYESVLRKVIDWAESDRFALVQEVLKSLAPAPQESLFQPPSDEYISEKARQVALDELDGMLASIQPSPTDDAIRRLLEERRMRRSQ